MKVLNCGFPPGVSTSNENNSSMVLKITFGQMSLLLTGDAETPVNSYLMQNFGADLFATILKVNHHGSSDGTTSAWVQMVSPETAVISCGAGNPYGHPHSSTLQNLQSNHVEIFRTDLLGNVSVTCDSEKGWVWSYGF
jgi:competence protein ComEC